MQKMCATFGCGKADYVRFHQSEEQNMSHNRALMDEIQEATRHVGLVATIAQAVLQLGESTQSRMRKASSSVYKGLSSKEATTNDFFPQPQG